MNERNHYSLSGNAVDVYEQNIVPAVMAPFAKGLLEFADLKVGEHVLDVGCGTGILARFAWPFVAPSGRVVGVDLSASMLAVARSKADEGRLPITWEHADAASMPVPDRGFDAVLCQHGLQYFPDRLAALNETRRTLRPSGRLILSVWRPIQFNPGHAVFANVLERLVSQPAAAERRAPFALSDRNEIRNLLVKAGFREVVVHLDARVARFPSAEAMVRIMIAGSPLSSVMSETNPAVLQNVIAEVVKGLSEYEDDTCLALPMQAWVVTATA